MFHARAAGDPRRPRFPALRPLQTQGRRLPRMRHLVLPCLPLLLLGIQRPPGLGLGPPQRLIPPGVPAVMFRRRPVDEPLEEPTHLLGAADGERGCRLLDLARYKDPVSCMGGGVLRGPCEGFGKRQLHQGPGGTYSLQRASR